LEINIAKTLCKQNKYMNKVYFTDIVKNEDGSFNFHKAVFNNDELESSGDESNIILESEDVIEGLKKRVESSIEVFVDGESVGMGEVA